MKHLYQKYIILFAAFCILALTGCSNVFSPAQQESGLMITVSADVNPRTLYPDTSFTKYVLSFSGPAAHENVTVQNGQTSAMVSGLAEGQWTITAVGYVTINGTEYPAAQGSANITIVSGTFQNITIPISASQAGDEGFFSYRVSYPQAMVDTATLWIFPFGTNQWDSTPINLSQTPADTIPLAPGYYMMTIQLYNENHTAGRTEVVHIYTNMETKAEYTFVENDFSKTITLSGTVTITVDGEPLDENRHINIEAYRDADYSDWVLNANTNWQDNTWSVKIAPFDADTPLYFKVRFETNFGEVERRIGVRATVKDQHIANINLVYNQTVVTLSGTVNVMVNGSAPQGNVSIAAYRNANYSDYVGGAQVNLQNNTWSMRRLPFETDTPLYFSVSFNSGNSGSVVKGTGVSVVVNNASINNINLGTVNLSALILGGTVDIRIDNEPLDEHRFVTVTAYRNADYSDDVFNAWVSLWEGNTWAVTLDPFEVDTPLYFKVRFDCEWGYFEKETGVNITAKDQNRNDIDLAYNLALLTLSGAFNVTVNGSTPQSNIWVNAYRNADYTNPPDRASTQVDLQNNTWSMKILPFEDDTTLYFAVGFSGFRKETGVSRVAKDQNINNINLGAVNFDIITLSGTAEITVNGETPNNFVDVGVYRDADYNDQINSAWVNLGGGNTWSMVFEPFATDTPLYFLVSFFTNNGGFVRRGTGVSVTIKDQDISGIAIVYHFTD